VSVQRSREVVEQARRDRDEAQSALWTGPQKHSILGLIRAEIANGASSHGWSYTDVDHMGSPLLVKAPTGRTWRIDGDGVVSVHAA
jgi:hypothetical protein